ncbi:MAG: hypothetical protein JRJ59_09700 [Deltaproteobacteria bacterium]|nr:hypothetical protein [Deltaproteobacteria bacterium]
MDFGAWDKKSLVTYIDWFLRHYRVVDAFWFLNVERVYGLDQACHFNELVWGKATELAARDLKARFGLDEGGLRGFIKALQMWPWAILVGYQIEERPEEVLLSVPSCPPQEARLKRGLGEYNCQAMHAAEFMSFAQEIDPRIKVECLFAPPDEHPPDCFCKWRFTLSD